VNDPEAILRAAEDVIGILKGHRLDAVVIGPFGLLHIISYANKFPAVIEDALRLSKLVVRKGSPLRIVPIPHLVALKLYAGGYKSKADIVQLLARNPGLDLDEIRTVCKQYRLKGLDELLTESSRRQSR